MSAAELITDDRGGASMPPDGALDLERRCTACRRPVVGAVTRSGRCDDCTAHATLRSGRVQVVDPFSRFEDDPAAQAFVAAIPDGGTLEQVGEAFGVTRERIRQMEMKSLERLRKRAAIAGITPEDLARALTAGHRRQAEHMSGDGGGGERPPMKTAKLAESAEPLSPLGLAIERAVLDVDAHAALLEELVRRTDALAAGRRPGPIPTALEHQLLELEGLPNRSASVVAPSSAPPVNAGDEGPGGLSRTDREVGPNLEGVTGGERPAQPTVSSTSLERAQETRRMAKEIEWSGQSKTIADWAAALGVTASCIRQRLGAGKNPDGSPRDASSPPPRSRKPRGAASSANVVRELAQAQDPVALLERLGVVHELVGETPKGRIVLFPVATPDA